MFTGRTRMREPGILAISVIETPSFGWTARISWFGSAQRAGVVVAAGTTLERNLLRRRDLHLVDEAAVPDRLEDAVGEPEHQGVLDGVLAEVVVDAVDLARVEHREQRAVQVQRRREVV